MKHAIVKYRVDLGVYSICRSSEFSGSGLAYNVMLVFSERELMFTFAICYRPSVCRLSVVCNVRAPYSGGSNFRQYLVGNIRLVRQY